MATTDDTLSHDGGVSKHRVSRACDRCRLKKSKCDGQRPCNRCKLENQVCLFSEKRRCKDKTYPKGYVELLEHQQGLLVAALQQIYRQSWTQLPLPEDNGNPRVHDILESMGLLSSPQQYSDSIELSKDFHFEEEPLQMQWSLAQTDREAETDSPDLSSAPLPPSWNDSQASRFANTITISAYPDNHTTDSPYVCSPLDTMKFSESLNSDFTTEMDTDSIGDIDPKVRTAIEFLRSKCARDRAAIFDLSYPLDLIRTSQDERISIF